MESIFGLSMQTLAIAMTAILLILLGAIAFIAVRNRFLIKLSLRNIPRRRAQSILIIVGLMLSSTIVSASLAMGDTITNSIRSTVLDGIGDTDITVSKPVFGDLGDPTLTAEEIEEIAIAVYSDPRVDGIMPITTEQGPILNQRTRLTEVRAVVRGYDVDGAVGNFKPQAEGSPGADNRLSPFALHPTIDGDQIDFASLADDEVLINEPLGDKLDAQAGDVLTVITPLGRHDFRLRAIMEIGGMAANDLRVLMPLTSHDRIYGNEPGTATRVDISLDVDNHDLEIASEEIVDALVLQFTDAEIAVQLHSAMKPIRGEIVSEIRSFIDENTGTPLLSEANEETLNELIAEIERDEPSDLFRILLSSDTLAGIFFGILSSGEYAEFADLVPQLVFGIAQLERLSATQFKVELLEIAELVGNLFFTLFTFFGSFSVIVGLLLIFLIFVLLASERQHEMGIARAVGTKRGHLVQMFTFEGLAYAIGAAAAGTTIGLAVSRAMVGIMANVFGTSGGESFRIDFNVTLYSIMVAFSVGLILTFLTVIFSAYRVSKLNIVVAIRNLPEEFVASQVKPLKHLLIELAFWLFIGPTFAIYKLIRRVRKIRDEEVLNLRLFLTLFGINVVMVATVVLILIFIPFSYAIIAPLFGPFSLAAVIGLIVVLVRILIPYSQQGWPYIFIGGALLALGFFTESAWQAYIGISIVIYGLALLARVIMTRIDIREEIASRIAYTIGGMLILIVWAMPQRFTGGLTDNLEGDVELFILAGFFMVASAVWVIMFNSDIIARALQSLLAPFNALRPIMKPAVAYAVANRFRTGLTVSMFALVIFVLMSFSILNQSFSQLLQTPENVTGGFDIRAEISPELPIEDIAAAIDAAPELDISDFEFIAGQSYITATARQVDGSEARFLSLNVRGTDREYFERTQLKITAADPAYLPPGTDMEDPDARAQAVWNALAQDPNLVVISNEHVVIQGPFAGGQQGSLMKLEDIEFGEEGYFFNAKEIEIRTGLESDDEEGVRRTIIALIDNNAESIEGPSDGGPPPGFFGIYTDYQIFSELTDEPVPYTIYRMNLAEGVDPSRTAATLQTVFLDHSMLAVDTTEELRAAVGQNEQFSLLFQGFMALGLVVGVAALGVLSLRAVNERRMQIAIMRAIGYRAGMIRIQFIMESIIITIVGTSLGMGLGALLSWSFLDDIAGSNQGLAFDIPWLSILAVVGITVTAALITTYVPARQASQVHPAEALRYE